MHGATSYRDNGLARTDPLVDAVSGRFNEGLDLGTNIRRRGHEPFGIESLMTRFLRRRFNRRLGNRFGSFGLLGRKFLSLVLQRIARLAKVLRFKFRRWQ